MVSGIDLGDGTLHPRGKLPLAGRLVRQALAAVYGVGDERGGPRVEAVGFANGEAVLGYRAPNGLAPCGASLTGFSVAGGDRRWRAAQARIAGTTVVVRSGAVPAPVAVRYAWAPYPIAALCDGAGEPAPPFRSDDWLPQ